MIKYLSRVLRALIITCLGAGGGIGLMVFIISVISNPDDPKSFQFGLQTGLSFGILAALLVGAVGLLMDLTARLFLAKGAAHKDVWQLEQTRDLQAEGTAKEVVSASRQALLAVPYVKAVSDDLENLITRASVGTSWRSAGEEMEVEINPLEERRWNIRCTSRPRTSNMLFDYGKNFENVEVWLKEFHQIIANPDHETRI